MLRKIVQSFKPYLAEGVCIAFSGGVDSSLLLKAACLARADVLQDGSSLAKTDILQDDTSLSKTDVLQDDTSLSKTDVLQDDTSLSKTDVLQDGTSLAKTDILQDEPSLPPILAIVAETSLHPHEDTLLAQELAQSMGADCIVLKINEFADPQIMNNPVNRCYLCKRLLFSSIKKTALKKGCLHVFDGTNINDTTEYRPGLAALKELNILSPLKDLGVTKDQVREISRTLHLKTFDKPSTPCMATRLPYGARLEGEMLNRLHMGEQFLRKLGFYNVRLRYHEPLLRIEVDIPAFPQLLAQKPQIVQRLKELGFTYITLDLEGFRSGSMDIPIKYRA